MTPTRRRVLALLALAPMALASTPFILSSACDIKPDTGYDRQAVLRDLVTNVMVPTYADLATAAVALESAVAALRARPSADTLATAQKSYREARAQLKASEAFAYGPAEDLAITGGVIDSWPADGAAIEARVSGTQPLGVSDVGTFGANQRGFPALEQLLFDESAPAGTVLARFTEPPSGARRAQLAASLATDLASKCRALSDAWSTPNGYGLQLAEAGVDSDLFRNASEGIDKVVTGLVALTELMVMRKLGGPLGVAAAPQPEESARSDSSRDDLRNDLLGIQAVYLGVRGARAGQGLGTPVKTLAADADTKFQQALRDALAAVDALQPSFRVALAQDRPKVQAAYEAVRVVKQQLTTQITSTLGASLGFGYSDTD